MSPSSSAGEGAGGPRRPKLRYVFVVTTARAGSTLLRYLLDSHPEISCPPELNLSAYLQHTVDLWSRVEETANDGPELPAPGPVALRPEARRKGRRAVDAVATKIAAGKGAAVFCDKSLTTVDHLGLVSQCFPEAAFVFLYRYPLDVIASGIEASRWGFNAYGFAPYVGSAPGNFVAGLANYWTDKVSTMAAFEASTEHAHARVYYELLCDDPAGTLRDLFDFLGVRSDAATVEAVLAQVFSEEHGLGPGDYKIDFTGSIRRDSIGRGSLLPQLIAPQQTARMDELLAELDYPSLASAWQGDLGMLIGLKPAPAGERAAALQEVVSDLGTLLERGVAALKPDHTRHLLPLEVVVHGTGGAQRSIRLDEQGDIEGGAAGKREDVVRIHCEGGVLLEVATGRLNVAQLLQDGRLRLDRSEEEGEAVRIVPRRVLLALSAALSASAAGEKEPRRPTRADGQSA